jgi:hypothetical protein
MHGMTAPTCLKSEDGGYHALGGDHVIIPILRARGLLAPGAPHARELVAA